MAAVTMISSIFTLQALAIITRLSIDGMLSPLCHFVTAEADTPVNSYISFMVMPAWVRICLIFCPVAVISFTGIFHLSFLPYILLF